MNISNLIIYKQQILYKILAEPIYTRPENYEGLKVPKILISGNTKEIERWRDKKSLERTKKYRPDLL